MQTDGTDPANIELINEVLDTLKFKNCNSQQADGQIAEFMHPNPVKIKEALDKEKEVIRKLNYSGVVPIDKSGQDPKEPSRLIQLQHRHGIKNNKKQPPQTENIYYQALIKAAKEDSKAKESSINGSKRSQQQAPHSGSAGPRDRSPENRSVSLVALTSCEGAGARRWVGAEVRGEWRLPRAHS